MRIKDSPLCTFCNESDDSNEHMLIECGKVKTLWTEVENRIAEVGVADYLIAERIIVLGELQRGTLDQCCNPIDKKGNLQLTYQ